MSTDAESLLQRAERLRDIARALSDADAVKVLEEFAAELVAKAEALMTAQKPPDGA